MSRFMSLIKMNIRLLLRNKAFLFFLCLTPILAVVILNLKTESSLYVEKEDKSNIIELESCSERAVYEGDTAAFIVKVYDASETDLSEYVLQELAKTGIFSVCRSDVSDMTEEEVVAQAKRDAFDDRAGVLFYLKRDFDTYVLSGEYEKSMQLFCVSDDERMELFDTELSDILGQIHQLAVNTGLDSGKILEMLESLNEAMPEKEVVNFGGKEKISLTSEQSSHRDHIGYAFAIITLGFIFCGVCVAHTVIEERDNKVYTRMMLSKSSQLEYLSAKIFMTIIISIMQTMILAIYMFIAKDMDFGINKFHFLGIIFLLGLIFSVLSFVIGVLVGDVMSSNYAVFSVWTISALLAGMYFPLNDTSATMKAISYLMPQRWFLKASEMLLVGDKGAFSMVLYVTVAYIVVIMSIGSVGLKIRSRE